jgi:hypothetical protein
VGKVGKVGKVGNIEFQQKSKTIFPSAYPQRKIFIFTDLPRFGSKK